MWRCDAFEGSCLPSKSAHLSCFCLLLALIFWPSVSKRKEKKRRHCSSQSNMCQIPCEGSLGHVKVLSSWTRSTTRGRLQVRPPLLSQGVVGKSKFTCKSQGTSKSMLGESQLVGYVANTMPEVLLPEEFKLKLVL